MNADEEQPETMVVSPYDAEYVLAGSVIIDADCGHRAWLSISGQVELRARSMRVVCANCLPSGPFLASAVPGALEELAAEFGDQAADRIIEVATAYGLARKPHDPGNAVDP